MSRYTFTGALYAAAIRSANDAAGEHVARWAARFAEPTSPVAMQLHAIAERAGWERHPDRTRNVARGIYLRLPGDVGLWVRRGELTPVGSQLETLRQALGA